MRARGGGPVPLVACLPPTYRTGFRAPATRAGRVERRTDTRAQGPGGQAAGVARARASERRQRQPRGRGGEAGVPRFGSSRWRPSCRSHPSPASRGGGSVGGSVRLCVRFPRRRVVAARGGARAESGGGRLKEGKKRVRLPCSGLSVRVRPSACCAGDLTVPDAPWLRG